MYRAPKRKVMIFSSLIAALLMIWSINLLKTKDNSITGQVVYDTAADRISIFVIFILISLVISALVYLTIVRRQSRWY